MARTLSISQIKIPESKPTVDQIVALLKKRPHLRVGIEGHTDNTGGRWACEESARGDCETLNALRLLLVI
jgi:hypothetical protein